MELRITATLITVLHRGKQVALHQRHGSGRFSTQPHHMPESHRRHSEWSPHRFLSWARKIGPATHTVVRHQLENRPHPEHGYRACLGILHQVRHYGNERLERACVQAVKIGSPTYKSIASILKKGLDRHLVGKGEAKATPSPLSQWGQFPIFTGVRLSRTGRLPGDSPSRGTIIATYTHG
uniref:Transposase n=2 Tax=Candidatus Kentrum sp. SD TaxID=2126332 RepID=A0A450YLD8_9GAMM|nr:MAG: hypothetical protein BECKSD772F_GA0070984_112012 [Candidatus Kentron sp. SD]VFK48222.1 MAG: hypothetical protein BECKSD772E_GA0070983_111712 [Candidatus Kentron sp. SD]